MISIVCKVVPQFEIPISANEMAGKASECVQVTFFQSTKWLTRLRPSTSRPYHSYPICYCTLRGTVAESIRGTRTSRATEMAHRSSLCNSILSAAAVRHQNKKKWKQRPFLVWKIHRRTARFIVKQPTKRLFAARSHSPNSLDQPVNHCRRVDR